MITPKTISRATATTMTKKRKVYAIRMKILETGHSAGVPEAAVVDSGVEVRRARTEDRCGGGPRIIFGSVGTGGEGEKARKSANEWRLSGCTCERMGMPQDTPQTSPQLGKRPSSPLVQTPKVGKKGRVEPVKTSPHVSRALYAFVIFSVQRGSSQGEKTHSYDFEGQGAHP